VLAYTPGAVGDGQIIRRCDSVIGRWSLLRFNRNGPLCTGGVDRSQEAVDRARFVVIV
jgi:hypothetical protein